MPPPPETEPPAGADPSRRILAESALQLLARCAGGVVFLDGGGKPVWSNRIVERRWPALLDALRKGEPIPARRPSDAPGACARLDPEDLPGPRPSTPTEIERVWTMPAPNGAGYLRITFRGRIPDDPCPHIRGLLEELKVLDRTRTEFMSNVSHELRTPLNAVIGYADLLLDGVQGDLNERQRETLGYLREAASGLLELISDLLAASRIESGKADLIIDAFALDPLIDGILRQLRPLYESKGLRVVVGIEADDTSMRSDRGKCRQILVNLLSNAIKFTSEGEIRLTIASESAPGGETMVLRVSDTGIGIEPEDRERIFEMFYQVDGSSSREHEGSGLGLYITRRLVELLGGEISMQSEPGRGSTFTVRLPKRLDRAAAVRHVGRFAPLPGTGAGGSPDAGRPVVILVGSTPDDARILASILETEGMSMMQAGDLEEIRRICRRLEPAAVVLDICTDPEQAWTLFHELKAEPVTAEVPLVFLTDSTEDDSRSALHGPLDRRGVARTLRQSGARGETPKILVVDDEESIRFAVGQFLRDEGFDVLEAGTGNEAVARAREERPDLILLDLGLPDISGWDVIRTLSTDPDLDPMHILILTGLALDSREIEDLNRIAGGFIRKDEFQLDRLVGQIDAVLAEKPARRTRTAPSPARENAT